MKLSPCRSSSSMLSPDWLTVIVIFVWPFSGNQLLQLLYLECILSMLASCPPTMHLSRGFTDLVWSVAIFFFFLALPATRCHCRKMSCSCRLESSVSWSPAAGSSSVRPWWRSWETQSATRPSLPTTATRGCWCTTASSTDSVSQHQKQRDKVSTNSPKLTKFCSRQDGKQDSAL